LIYIINPKEKDKKKHLFDLTDDGARYLNMPEEEKCRFLHRRMYSSIFHYKYAFDLILKLNLHSFNGKEFRKMLVMESVKDFGVTIFDKISLDNVIYTLLGVGVIKRSNGTYEVDLKFLRKFDEKRFEEELEKLLKGKRYEFTKSICEMLMERSDRFFYGEKEEISIEYIFNKLLKLYKLGKVNFYPGIPRPPIPSAYTLISLRR